MPRYEVNRAAIEKLEAMGAVNKGDLVLLTSGDHVGEHGGTNKMKILTVGNVV